LREDGKSHELGAQHISSARQSGQDKGAVGIRSRRVLLSCQSIRSRKRYARQRALATMNAASNLIGDGSVCLRRAGIFLRAQTRNHESGKPEEKKSPNKKSQCGGSGGFCGWLLSFGGFAGGGFAGGAPPGIPSSCMRFHCSGPMTITDFG